MTREVRGALVGYALTAGLCLVVVLSLFVRARNVRAHDAMVRTAAERVTRLAVEVKLHGASRPFGRLLPQDNKRVGKDRGCWLAGQPPRQVGGNLFA